MRTAECILQFSKSPNTLDNSGVSKIKNKNSQIIIELNLKQTGRWEAVMGRGWPNGCCIFSNS